MTHKSKNSNKLNCENSHCFSFMSPSPASIVQGKLMDGKVIDSSLSMDPLVVELGKRTVIAGKLTVNPFCVAQSVIL